MSEKMFYGSKPLTSEQLPNKMEEVADPESKSVVLPASDNDTSQPRTQEDVIRSFLAKPDLKPEYRAQLEKRRDELEARNRTPAPNEQNPQSSQGQQTESPTTGDDSTSSRSKLDDLRARMSQGRDPIQDQQAEVKENSGDISNNQTNDTSSSMGNNRAYQGNPNPHSHVAEVNGKTEPGNAIGTDEMARRTALHNRTMNNLNMKYSDGPKISTVEGENIKS